MSPKKSKLSLNQKLTLLIAILAVIAAIIAAFISGHDWFSGRSRETITNPPLDHIDHRFVVEMAPQVKDGADFWFYGKDHGDEFSFAKSMNGSWFNFFTTSTCAHSGMIGLQIEYEILDRDFAGWGLLWVDSPTKYFDASSFTKVVFWVKGNSEKDSFQVSLTDSNGGIFEIVLRDTPDEWVPIEISLTDFKGVDPSILTHVSFTFYEKNGPGSICIDDIEFE